MASLSDKSLPYVLQLAAAGITPDKPLHAVLVAVHEAAIAARDATHGARGLTPEGETALVAALVHRVGREVGVRLAPLPRVHLLRTGLLGATILIGVMALAGGISYAVGRAHGAAARVNELCQGAALQVQPKGGVSCSFWFMAPTGAAKTTPPDR